jgi:hypothetical protein
LSRGKWRKRENFGKNCPRLHFKRDQEAFADSAYVGEKIDAGLKARGYLPMICEKGYRNKPLTEEQKQMNRLLTLRPVGAKADDST